jgi:hypothetical protein
VSRTHSPARETRPSHNVTRPKIVTHAEHCIGIPCMPYMMSHAQTSSAQVLHSWLAGASAWQVQVRKHGSNTLTRDRSLRSAKVTAVRTPCVVHTLNSHNALYDDRSSIFKVG